MEKKTISIWALIVILAVFTNCTNNRHELQADSKSDTGALPAANIYQDSPEQGIGPFKKVDLDPDINISLAEEGKAIFEGRCTACHQFDDRFVGPPLGGVTTRRNPVWIMNMIINPKEMVEKDPQAMALLEEYQTPMMNMGVDEEDTRAILEYLRAYDQGKMK